jgi:hypothetical protein
MIGFNNNIGENNTKDEVKDIDCMELQSRSIIPNNDHKKKILEELFKKMAENKFVSLIDLLYFYNELEFMLLIRYDELKDNSIKIKRDYTDKDLKLCKKMILDTITSASYTKEIKNKEINVDEEDYLIDIAIERYQYVYSLYRSTINKDYRKKLKKMLKKYEDYILKLITSDTYIDILERNDFYYFEVYNYFYMNKEEL